MILQYIMDWGGHKYYGDMEGNIFMRDVSVHNNEVHFHRVATPPRKVYETVLELKNRNEWERYFWDVH